MEKNKTIIGVKELRENLNDYIAQISRGASFMVVRRSKPVFNIAPVDGDAGWEEAADFTKIKKGGIKIEELLSRL